MPNPLASARQLWRLNKEGRLSLIPLQEAQSLVIVPVSEVEADAAIKQGLEAAEVGKRLGQAPSISDHPGSPLRVLTIPVPITNQELARPHS